MRAVVFDQPGNVEVLRVAEVADPVPGAGEILVRVRAAGINRADLLQRQGRYPPPPGESEILGLEFAGDVVALGPGCTRYQVGDRVMALVAGGAYATRAVTPEATAWPVPPALGWHEAAAVPESFVTAWLNLFDMGALQSGETVLVHAGASGVGSAVIQLARESGATVFATAGSDAKLDLCRRLGATRAFHREQEDFPSAVLQATGGAGVHLVIDFVGAPYWAGNLRALRPGGRLVLVGFLGGSSGELDLGSILRKSLVVRGTTLRARPRAEKARLCDAAAPFVLPRLADGRLRPAVDRAFPLAEVAAAHTYVAGNRSAGKVVLEF